MKNRAGGKKGLAGRQRACSRRMVWFVCVGAVSLMSVPAAMAVDPSFYRLHGDCAVIVECGIRPLEPLVYTAGNVTQEVDLEVEVFMSRPDLDRACPEVRHVAFVDNGLCSTSEGTRVPSNLSFKGGGPMQPGWNHYDVKLEHSFSQATACQPRLRVEALLEDGTRHQFSCLDQNMRLFWDRSGAGTLHHPTREEQQRVQAVGESYFLPFSFERASEQELFYTLSFEGGQRDYNYGVFINPDSEPPRCSAPLDEVVACSSDRFPVCGCDTRVWPSACDAARAGVGVASESPNHSSCQQLLAPVYSGQTPLPDPIVYADAPMCGMRAEPQVLFNGVLSQSLAERELYLMSDPLTPRAIVPWSAQYVISPRESYHYTGYIKQDLERAPEQCNARSYRLHACSSNDPCCGRDESCDVHDERLRRCAELGDADCDGLEDALESAQGVNVRDQDGDGLLDGLEFAIGTRLDAYDSDGDGLGDFEEWSYLGTDPLNADTDDDGVSDMLDPEPRLADRDGDGLLDGEDAYPDDFDQDRDGLPGGFDDDETNPDQDGDGLLDGVEVAHGFDQAGGVEHALPWIDSDGDGLRDDDELFAGSSPTESDTDGDGLTDLQEVSYGSSPTRSDTDGDGLSDFDEVYVYHTYPDRAHSDEDDLFDGDEVLYLGSHPRLDDTDGDGYHDGLESRKTRTWLTQRDTDEGGFIDEKEWLWGGDLYDASDDEEVRVMEVLHELGEDASITFSRNDGELAARMRIEVTDPEDDSLIESLATRTVALPYHQAAQLSYYGSDVISSSRLPMVLMIEAPDLRIEPDHVILNTRGQSLLVLIASRDDPSTFLRVTLNLIRKRYLGKNSVGAYQNTTFSGSFDDTIESFALEGNPHRYTHAIPLTVFQNENSFFVGSLLQETEITRLLFEIAADVVHVDDLDFDPYALREVCGNGLDDDRDGLIDCMDREDCASRCVDFEVCDDGVDNDEDGLIDLNDPYCEEFSQVRPEVCWDQVDNDQDGFIDLDDGDCQERLHCDDGIDNDLDGLLDREDILDCPVEDCEDGIDNDGDGFIDCLDDKCAFDYFCCDLNDTCGGEVCNDGFDNDFDGLIDCQDDECRRTEACMVPGVSPRGGIAGRLQDACGCDSVARPVPTSTLPIPRELLFVMACGGVALFRRRKRRV